MRISRPAAIMGLADGIATGIGLSLGLSAGHQVHAAIWLAGLSGGLASFPGMASGRYQSEPAGGVTGAAVCGLATTAGSVLTVLPFLLVHGAAAVAASIAVAAVLCALVAVLRPEAGWQAWVLSYGITAVAGGLCVAAALAGG
jgi:VIT1/CCC1 family predicted Fe2+/Mn2+ transporter